MKYIKITETDPKYRENFTSFLVQLGAVPVSGEDFLFQVEDGFDADAYHGLEMSSEKPVSFESKYGAEIAWLNAYTGTFDFYVSLKKQFERKGSLSPAQMEALTRAVQREASKPVPSGTSPVSPVIPGAAKTYSITPGTVIIVGKWLAEKIGREAGYHRAHHALEVVKVEAETERAYKLTVKLSAQRTSHCCVCGLSLTNAASVAAGIGPICAEKSGVSMGEGSLDGIAEKLRVTVQVSTWLPKKSIKERKEK